MEFAGGGRAGRPMRRLAGSTAVTPVVTVAVFLGVARLAALRSRDAAKSEG